MKKRTLLAVVAGVVALSLAGCSSPSTPNETGSRDVSVQLYNAPSTFSPLILQVGGNQLIQTLHWDSLVGVDDQGQFEPRLAESWEVSDDATVWTFHLREGVNWSDGEPFTSDDVVYTLNLMADPESGSQISGVFADIVGAAEVAAGTADSVSGIEAVDDTTVTLTLTHPNSAKIIDFAEPQYFMLPEHVYGEMPVADLATNPAFREPEVGIGPYLFSKWVTDEEVEFVPNPEYREDLGLDHVYAKFMATDASQAQLQTGEIDFSQVAASDADRIRELSGVSFHEIGGPGIMALHNAWDAGKLSDPRVRQAIMYGIDREALVDQVIAGYGEVVDTVQHGPDWAVPDDLVHYTRDVDKAKELLAEAGWDPATEVRLEIVPGPKDREQALTIIAGQLQEIGMNAKVTQYDNAALGEAIKNRDFDLLISGYGLFNVDPAALNVRLLCDNGALSGYCNPDLDAALLAGIATTDQDERAAAYADAQHIINTELPIFPLYVPDTLAATSERLKGFKVNPLPTNAFWNIAEWTVE
ncbi:ABC transporter substrate-binding protein [Microbacterium sp. NPDC028030]|uniref:ABC transporter substrate-binding protein n=1 Tax=Microbacterium sp. NPDC028030 TaxID=3155124 RepID=UPI0033FE95AB